MRERYKRNGTAQSKAPGDRRKTVNALVAIYRYKGQGLWVFDDAKVGFCQEPFMSGADSIAERTVAGIPDARSGFNLVVSAGPFAGRQAVFEWRREGTGGCWHYSPELETEGWPCPALLKYFEAAPRKVCARFKPKAV